MIRRLAFVMLTAATVGCATGPASAPTEQRDGLDALVASVPTVPAFETVTAGRFHTCGLRADGTIDCWGLGADSRATGPHDYGQADPPEGQFRMVDAGWYHTCAVAEDGRPVCWGRSAEGQTEPPEGTFRQVSAGRHFACGLRTDGTAVCWGEMGGSRSGPTDRTRKFDAISAGWAHACGRADPEENGCPEGGCARESSADDSECWGLGVNPEVSEGPNDFDQASPRPDGGAISALSAGRRHTCWLAQSEGDHRRVVCVGGERSFEWRLDRRDAEPTDLALSDRHACLLLADGSIDCRGNNASGQAITREGPFRAVTAGVHHTCAVRTDGRVDCWGAGDVAPAAGEPARSAPHFGQSHPPGTLPVDLSVGAGQICLRYDDGEVRCAGGADDAARRVLDSGPVHAFEIGGTHGCALVEPRDAGPSDHPYRFSCWQNTPGPDRGLVDPSSRSDSVVKPTPPIAVGGAHRCVRQKFGGTVCLGLGASPGVYEGPGDRHQGVRAPLPDHPHHAGSTAGEWNTCGSVDEDAPRCIGEPGHGKLDEPEGEFRTLSAGRSTVCGERYTDEGTRRTEAVCWGNWEIPDDLRSEAYTDISVGRGFACGIERGSHRTRCWGPAAEDFDPPGEPMRAIDAATLPPATTGEGWICGVTRAGELRCWGGDPEALEPDATHPAEPDATAEVVDLALGPRHTCLLHADGTTDCWGAVDEYQTESPDVALVAVDGGGNYNCGLTEAGEVRCWGGGKPAPTAPVDGRYESVVAAEGRGCALDEDGRVDCWSLYGRLAPPPDGRFEELSFDGAVICGMRTDGTIDCWFPQRGEPIDDPDMPEGSFSTLDDGDVHTCAVRDDGSVACWGTGSDRCNDEGRKDNDQAVPPEGSFQSVAVGRRHSCGLRTDGTLVCWGIGASEADGGDEAGLDFGQSRPPEGTFDALWSGPYHACARRTGGPVVCWGLGSAPDEAEGDDDFNQAWRPRTWRGQPGIETHRGSSTERSFDARCPEAPPRGGSTGGVTRAEVQRLVDALHKTAPRLRAIPNYDNGERRGLKVIGFSEESIAGRLGLKPGDVLLEVDGQKVERPPEVFDLFKHLAAEGRVPVVLMRGDERVTRTLRTGRSDGADEKTQSDGATAAEPNDQAEETGKITVYAKPKGRIVVDGRPTEEMTPGTVEVPAGERKVRVDFQSGEASETKTVGVDDEARIKLFFRQKD